MLPDEPPAASVGFLVVVPPESELPDPVLPEPVLPDPGPESPDALVLASFDDDEPRLSVL